MPLAPGNFVLLGGPALIHSFGSNKSLAEKVLGPKSPLFPTANGQGGGVELALGIRLRGNVELLLTSEQANLLVAHGSLQYTPNCKRSLFDYESVSPILFHTPTELNKKLVALYKDSGKKAKRATTFESTEGLGRGVFEHGRVMYSILKNILDPTKYGLPEPTWKGTMKIFSFVFNTSGSDKRVKAQRELHPLLVDIGWSEATIPDMSPKPGATKHVRVYERRFMNATGIKLPFSYGDTEQLEEEKIGEILQDVFGSRTESTAEPIILLVHDAQLARNVLKNFGVDTSTWAFGLKGLLGFGKPEIKYQSSPSPSYSRPRSSSYKREELDYGRQFKREDSSYGYPSNSRHGRRSRSPSPRRSIKPDPEPPTTHNRYHNRRDYTYSSPAPRTHAPVYVVEVKQLYTKLMRMDSGSESVARLAQRFNLRGAAELNGWCAGNEAVYLFEIWNSMVSGPPIDDQYKAREKGWIDGPGGQAQSTMEPAIDEDDPDWDPNDAAFDQTRVQPEPTRKSGPYQEDTDSYDDDSDY